MAKYKYSWPCLAHYDIDKLSHWLLIIFGGLQNFAYLDNEPRFQLGFLKHSHLKKINQNIFSKNDNTFFNNGV